MNTKVNAQALEVNELEQVAGGTVGEMREILTAFFKNNLTGQLSTIESSAPGYYEVVKDSVTKLLSSNYGIKATIDLGFLGLGIGSDPNSYIEIATGRSLTHSEVLARIG